MEGRIEALEKRVAAIELSSELKTQEKQGEPILMEVDGISEETNRGWFMPLEGTKQAEKLRVTLKLEINTRTTDECAERLESYAEYMRKLKQEHGALSKVTNLSLSFKS